MLHLEKNLVSIQNLLDKVEHRK